MNPQQKYYESLSPHDRRRFWIQASRLTPEQYEHLVQQIKPATKAAREFVEVFRPVVHNGAGTRAAG